MMKLHLVTFGSNFIRFTMINKLQKDKKPTTESKLKKVCGLIDLNPNLIIMILVPSNEIYGMTCEKYTLTIFIEENCYKQNGLHRPNLFLRLIPKDQNLTEQKVCVQYLAYFFNVLDNILEYEFNIRNFDYDGSKFDVIASLGFDNCNSIGESKNLTSKQQLQTESVRKLCPLIIIHIFVLFIYFDSPT